MKGIKRKAAVFGLTMLTSIMIMLFTGTWIATAVLPVTAATCAVLLLKRYPSAMYLLIITAAIATSALALYSAQELKYEPAMSYVGKNISVTGTVAEHTKQHPATKSVKLKNCTFNGTETKHGITVYFKGETTPEPGDTFSFFAAEIFSSANKNSKYFYHTLSEGGLLSAFSTGKTELIKAKKRTVTEKLLIFRQKIYTRISTAMASENAAVAYAILSGDKSDIPNDIKNNFRKSGISHIFAVSGMHLSMWAGVIFFIMTKGSKTKILPNITVIIFVILYSVFTGLSPSVLRAGIMLTVVCVGRLIKKQADPLNSLGIAAAALLTVNPWLGGNISFLLSFAATFALCTLFPMLQDYRNTNSKLLQFIHGKKDELLLSFTVLFFSVPLTSYFFGYISVLSPLTSLVCTPLARIMMISSAAGAAFPTNTALAKIAFQISSFASHGIIKITEKAASFNFAICPLRETYIAVWFIITIIAIIAVKYLFKNSRRALLNTLAVLCSAVLLFGIIQAISTTNNLTLYIPDAGNATSLCLISGNGNHAAIIGCGGDYNSYTKMRDKLNGKTVFSADYIIIPREHAAETSMFKTVTDDFCPKELILPQNTELPENRYGKTRYADNFSHTIFKNANIEYSSTESFCEGILTLNGKKIVFCLYPQSETSEKYADGDILICRGMIPSTIDPKNFEEIIVLSDHTADELMLPPNAKSTADTGEIEITIPKQ